MNQQIFFLKTHWDYKKTVYLCDSKAKTTVFCVIFDSLEGVYQSGQMGQTVNLLVHTFGGSNPSAPTLFSK